jgi:hypothetical protein
MRIRTDDGQTLSLGPASFVATGGEASIYAVGDTAYKIYTDPARVLPASKRVELARLEHPSIQVPQGFVTDPSDGRPIGISLPFIARAVPLASLVARTARARHGIDFPAALGLMARLQEAVTHCHAKGIQIVDLNSMNILVRTGGTEPELFLIDVDSWQSPTHAATALQDAVRDRRAPAGVFSAKTDWFSYAVVALQFLLGVHPYKGKHPRLHGLEARMSAQVSIFDPDVRVPPVCGDMSALPERWRNWVERVLQTDYREPPPPLLAPAHPVPDARVFHENRMKLDPPRGPWVLTRTPKSGRPVRVSLEDGGLRIWALDTRMAIPFGLHVDAISACEGQVHLRSGTQILELQIHEAGRTLLATALPRARVLTHGTRLFDGLAIQDLLGTAWLSRLDRPGMSPQLHMPELDGKRVVHGRATRGMAQVWTEERGRFDRLDISFDSANSYRATWTQDVELESSNHTVETHEGHRYNPPTGAPRGAPDPGVR